MVKAITPTKATPAPLAPAIASPATPIRQRAVYEKDVEVGACSITLPGQAPFEFSLTKIPQALHRRLAFHGLIQKVVDSAAGESGVDAISAMAETYDSLCRGVWAERVKVDPAARQAKIVEAIVTVFSGAYARKYPGKAMTVAVVRAYPPKVLGQLSKDPKVQQLVGRSLVDPTNML